MNKRILSLVAVVMILMTMFAFASPAMADMNYYAYSKCSNGKPLNVRSGPGKEYGVIGTLPYGTQMLVYQDRGDGWSELYWGSEPGFVMTSLISKKDPGKYVAPTTTSTTKTSTTTTEEGYNSLFASAKFVAPYTITLKASANSNGVANVRWAPSKKATLLKKYPAGTEVQVIAELGKNWYQVSDADGAVGFVNTAYVTK